MPPPAEIFNHVMFLSEHLFHCMLQLAPKSYTLGPGAHISKASECFRARKAILNSSASRNGELYAPEASCIKGTSVHEEYVNKTALQS